MTEKAVVKLNADGVPIRCAKGLDLSQCGFTPGSKVCGKCGAMAVEVKSNLDDDEEIINAKGEMISYEGMSSMDMDPKKKRRAARKRRIESMGMKSAEIGEDDYLCAYERKMHPGSAMPCAACPGGCAPEQGLPTILEIEGIAEEMFGGKVLDSGYGEMHDLFLVHVERKDGKPVEAFFDGTTGECEGWQVLHVNTNGKKSALLDNMSVIGMADAMEIATKSVRGEVVMVDADEFNGSDVWVVEIEGKDGMYHDVFIDLNGNVVGREKWTAEEVADIDAEAAEYLMKAMYTPEQREMMAEEGLALPDGSYPIKDGEDLQNAIQAFGRAKDKERAKAHIMKRARELGMMELVPENWMQKRLSTEGLGGDEVEVEGGDEFLATLMEFENIAAENGLVGDES